MTDHIFKCSLGNFNIKDAFDVTDLLFEKNYMSVSCLEVDNHWIVEALHNEPIEESEILRYLKLYDCKIIENKALKSVDWLQKSFENLKPIVIGEFYIYGTHLRGNKIPPHRIPIEISSYMAFGSGEHPTTSRCIAACHAFFDHQKHKNVLDFGCGSGILGIALAKLGARNVIACDNDAEAVRVSREHAIINKVAHRISVFRSHGAEFFSRSYDFIVSNILAEPLTAMSAPIAHALSENGILILSGFASNDFSVINQYASFGFKQIHRYDCRGWTTLVLKKARV
ncbi:MAG: 50S ribosomal protein L11 methyltransferase [Holosporaceae bacterium]|jgi:ribosomal protein L11 methyltransferase|nr:50S ribosomal protein L11 methyltransferase [Holosporaceae bacterium]